MATLAYRDEDGKRRLVKDIHLVRGGALIGAPSLDADEVKAEMAAAGRKASKAAKEESPTEFTPEMWTLVTTPEQYLKRSPSGPQAEMAIALVKAGHGDITAAETDEEDENED